MTPSPRPSVPTGFAVLMACLALVGVGLGFATSSALQDSGPSQTAGPTTSVGTSLIVPTTAVLATTTSVPLTAPRPSRLLGPKCRELKSFAPVAHPSFVAGTEEVDDDVLMSLLPSGITRLPTLAKAATYRDPTPSGGVVLSPNRTTEPLTSLTKVSNVTILYQPEGDPLPGDTAYPAVLVLLPADRSESGLHGLEQLVADLITKGSAVCAPA